MITTLSNLVLNSVYALDLLSPTEAVVALAAVAFAVASLLAIRAASTKVPSASNRSRTSDQPTYKAAA